jgi:hypothetical protein
MSKSMEADAVLRESGPRDYCGEIDWPTDRDHAARKMGEVPGGRVSVVTLQCRMGVSQPVAA